LGIWRSPSLAEGKLQARSLIDRNEARHVALRALKPAYADPAADGAKGTRWWRVALPDRE